jgi:hypothetical protein
LTTPPDTALSVDLPPSFKELHGTSRERGEKCTLSRQEGVSPSSLSQNRT